MHRLIRYGFPLALILFEWGFRQVHGGDAKGFIGPTLAAAALAGAAPLTELKRLPIGLDSHPEAVAFSKRDVNFVYALWGILIVGMFAWLWSCQLSIEGTVGWLELPMHYWVGLVSYTLSVMLGIFKERV